MKQNEAMRRVNHIRYQFFITAIYTTKTIVHIICIYDGEEYKGTQSGYSFNMI